MYASVRKSEQLHEVKDSQANVPQDMWLLMTPDAHMQRSGEERLFCVV